MQRQQRFPPDPAFFSLFSSSFPPASSTQAALFAAVASAIFACLLTGWPGLARPATGQWPQPTAHSPHPQNSVYRPWPYPAIPPPPRWLSLERASVSAVSKQIHIPRGNTRLRSFWRVAAAVPRRLEVIPSRWSIRRRRKVRGNGGKCVFARLLHAAHVPCLGVLLLAGNAFSQRLLSLSPHGKLIA